jgi:hypothetical protein
LKLGRTLDHLDELSAIVKPWTDGDRHTTRCEIDTQVNIRTFFATAEQPPKDLIGPIIGDVLHNIRSALDNLAYALACAFTNPLPADFETGSEFPIFGNRDKSGAVGIGQGKFQQLKRDGSPAPTSGLFKIQGWDPAAQTIVEGLQPYHRGNAFESDPLWLLHDLDRIDKHRSLHIAVAAIQGARLGFNPKDRNLAGWVSGTFEALGAPVETDTPYFRITGTTLTPVDPSKEVYMDVPLLVDVSFAPGTPNVENQPVYKTLAEILTYVETTVVAPLASFL